MIYILNLYIIAYSSTTCHPDGAETIYPARFGGRTSSMVFPTRAMHRSIAMGVEQTDRQTDGRIAILLIVVAMGGRLWMMMLYSLHCIVLIALHHNSAA